MLVLRLTNPNFYIVMNQPIISISKVRKRWRVELLRNEGSEPDRLRMTAVLLFAMSALFLDDRKKKLVEVETQVFLW